MYDKMSGISIKGKYFSELVLLKFFDKPEQRLSVVFGRNGSGKSTCAMGFKICAGKMTDPDITAQLIDKDSGLLVAPEGGWPNLFVFDEDYVNKKVQIEDGGLHAIVLLGEQVDVKKELESIAKESKPIEDDQVDINTACSAYADNKNPKSPLYQRIKIEKALREENGWAATDALIKGSKTNTKVTDSVIKSLINMAPFESLSVLEKEFNEKMALFYKIRDAGTTIDTPSVQFKGFEAKERKICALLAQKIEPPVLSEREAKIIETIKTFGEGRITEIKDTFSNEKQKFCPYCSQEISDTHRHDLLASIENVLKKEEKKHKEDLMAAIIELPTLNIVPLKEIEPTLCEQAESQHKICQAVLAEYTKLLKEKMDKTYTPIQSSNLNLTAEISKLNGFLMQLEKGRVTFNDDVKKTNEIKKDLVLLNEKIWAKKLEFQIDQYQATLEAKAKVDEKKEQIEKELDKLRIRQSEVMAKKEQISIAVDAINKALQYVFFSTNRLQLKLKNKQYYLEANGKMVRPKDVSCGERNIIALCYFFTEIMEKQEVEKLYKKDQLLVIDDPISSFDFENRIGILTYLKSELQKVVMGNNNSKVIIFSHDLPTVFDLSKAIWEIALSISGDAKKERDTKKAQRKISCKELLQQGLHEFNDKKNDYIRLAENVYKYASDTEGEATDLTVGNNTRRLLEAFSTFIYRKNIQDISCDKEIIKKLNGKAPYFESLMYRIVLHNESHSEDRIKTSYDDMNFYEFLSPDEKRKTARSVLCLMYGLQPLHMEIVLKGIDGANNTLKDWYRGIPEEETLQAPLANKRMIKLYDLPVSAGTGNMALEDWTAQDYETENTECDFAVKTSGDSMEPNIHDGDILLVKRCEEIEENKVGIFFYNGAAYCKRLKTIKGKKKLVSDNADMYEPVEIKLELEFKVQGKVIE